MATINAITFSNSRLAALCRGMDKSAFDAGPPITAEEGEAFARSRLIKYLKIAYKRGQEMNHNDILVELPFDDILA